MLKTLKFFKRSTILPMLAAGCMIGPAHAATIPAPAQDMTLQASGEQRIVLAGGCFWGVQAVFQHIKGVKRATSGYAGGAAEDAHYDMVSGGRTGHAEAVEVIYDPAQVTYGQLLHIYFSVSHDPTEMNRQGPDSGTQYRSEIFYVTSDQADTAKAYITQLDAAKAFPARIATKVELLDKFYPAEDYHQNYATLHPDNPYIVFNDLPKVKNLAAQFPALYVEKPAL